MKYELLYSGETIVCEVVRSARKTMAIQVTKDGNVVVRLPNNTAESTADVFIKAHQDWIYKNYVNQKELIAQQKCFEWRDGSVFPLEGKECHLHVTVKPGQNMMRACWQDGCLKIETGSAREEYVAAAAKKWLKNYAKNKLCYKTKLWSEVVGVTYHNVAVREQVTRWGSCSTKGNLNYNWKLILMPEELMDYVVVHELCHRKMMNHSPQFWAEVGRILPDYKVLRRRLKEYENKIISQF